MNAFYKWLTLVAFTLTWKYLDSSRDFKFSKDVLQIVTRISNLILMFKQEF